MPFQALSQPGRKEGTQLGWGQWQGALGWASQAWMLPRLCVGHLPAHTPLLGQSQYQQDRSQERKEEVLAQLDRGGEGYCQPGAWNQDRQQTTPLPWGQAALIPEGPNRLNIRRYEHMSSDSCRKTTGTRRGRERLGHSQVQLHQAQSCQRQQNSQNRNSGIGQSWPNYRHKARGFTTAFGRTLGSPSYPVPMDSTPLRPAR